MDAVLKRKYIYLTEEPKNDIPSGLCLELDRESQFATERIYTNIYKGQIQYKRPTESELGDRRIIRVFIKRK